MTEVPAENLRFVQVIGDSMEPDLPVRSWVVVDATHTHPSPDGIYALEVLGRVDFKRLQKVTWSVKDPLIRVMADNKAYPAYELPLSKLSVLGMVVAKLTLT